jgi:hypothetical protein
VSSSQNPVTAPRKIGTPGLLCHDNARPHSSTQTTQKLAFPGYTILPHPPYSSDLAPSDYTLFNKMKEPLRGRKLRISDDLDRGVHDSVHSVSKDAAAIRKLPQRWQWCIDLGREQVKSATVWFVVIHQQKICNPDLWTTFVTASLNKMLLLLPPPTPLHLYQNHIRSGAKKHIKGRDVCTLLKIISHLSVWATDLLEHVWHQTKKWKTVDKINDRQLVKIDIAAQVEFSMTLLVPWRRNQSK